MSLIVKDVSLVLGDGDQEVTALNHVDMQVNPGELCVVLGPSGSGKSSLLAVCGGLRKPTDGEILIDDTNITMVKSSALTKIRREKIGFVFQQSNLVPSLTAMDQLLLLVHLRGRKPNGGDHKRADQ